MTKLKSKILDIVSKENIKMIPRWKFVLFSTLWVIGVFCAFLVAVFIGSLVIFVFSKYGFFEMSFLEFMTAVHALRIIPAILVVSTIVLLGIIEILSRKYAFSFRRPLGVTLLVSAATVSGISFVISQTPAHEYVREFAKNNNIQMVSRAYERPLPLQGARGVTVVRGEITEMSTSSAILKLFDGRELSIRSTTSLSDYINDEDSDDVVVFGRYVDDYFEVAKIKRAMNMEFMKRDNKKPHVQGGMNRRMMEDLEGGPRRIMK